MGRRGRGGALFKTCFIAEATAGVYFFRVGTARLQFAVDDAKISVRVASAGCIGSSENRRAIWSVSRIAQLTSSLAGNHGFPSGEPGTSFSRAANNAELKGTSFQGQ